MGDEILKPIFKRGNCCRKFVVLIFHRGGEILRPIFKLSNYCFCCPDKLFNRRENGHEIP